MIFKFGGKIDLKINWSVKKPLHGHKVVARSGLWATADIHCIQYKHSSSQKAFSEKKIQTVKLEKNQYGLMVELREVQHKRSKDKTLIWR